MFGCVCVNTTFRLPIAIVFLRKKLTDKPISNIPEVIRKVWKSGSPEVQIIIIINNIIIPGIAG